MTTLSTADGDVPNTTFIQGRNREKSTLPYYKFCQILVLFYYFTDPNLSSPELSCVVCHAEPLQWAKAITGQHLEKLHSIKRSHPINLWSKYARKRETRKYTCGMRGSDHPSSNQAFPLLISDQFCGFWKLSFNIFTQVFLQVS